MLGSTPPGRPTMSQTTIVVNGMRYPVPPQGIRIGRAPENDVVLADPNVSRQHLVVWSTPRGAFLRDLGSQNGTFLDGRRVGSGPETIPAGANVRIGVTELRIEEYGANGSRAGGYAGAGVGTGTAPARPADGGGGSGGSKTGVVVGGIIALLVVAVLGAGLLAVRAIGSSTSPTPTPTVRSISVSTTSTPAPTVAATPTSAPARPTAKPEPTVALTPSVVAKPTSPPATSPATGGRDPAFVRALGASVQVIVRVSATSGFTGSGSIITTKGHILTNYHVVSDEKTGKLINNGDGVIIAVPPTEGEPAKPKYLAKVVQFDSKVDLAILQIQSMVDGKPLPANLGLTPIPIGDSSKVQIGDSIVIIGFPGLGGASLTVTRGIHSGIARFTDDPGSFIKTDTEINHGNSGGTAINAAGELIGVPTAGRIDPESSGKIGLVRPNNEAKPLLAKVIP
jgi:S1-C subfamily serine protease